MQVLVKTATFALSGGLVVLLLCGLYAIWGSTPLFPLWLGKLSLTAGLIAAVSAVQIAVCDALLRIRRNSDCSSEEPAA